MLFFFFFVLCVGDDDDESPVMKIARAFLKETIRSARTLEFSLPIRRMPSLRTCAGPSFLGCLRTGVREKEKVETKGESVTKSRR